MTHVNQYTIKGVLSDGTLRRNGDKLITPFDPEAVEPSSIDLRLGQSFRVFNSNQHRHHVVHLDGETPIPEDLTTEVVIPEGECFVIRPGEFVLGSTAERIHVPHDLVSRVEGKSSIGRLGLIVHATAGYVDPGFEGNLTLEMANLLPVPIVLKPGIKICQVSFHVLDHPAEHPYQGRYQGDAGAVQSRYGVK